MASPEDEKGAGALRGEGTSTSDGPEPASHTPAEENVSYAPVTDASNANDGPYTYGDKGSSVQEASTSSSSTALVPTAVSAGGSGGSTPPPPPSDSDGDDEEGGMLRMSFLEHLEELRSRILKAL